MATQKALNLPPIWERSAIRTTKVTVFVNGDSKYPGKEINLNKRTCPNFDIWLDQLTNSIRPRNGAIRRLFTPRAGHRVNSLDVLQNGDKVVAGGYEEFKPCEYENITFPKKHGTRISYDVEPGHNKRYQVSARFKKIDSRALRIQCCVNGKCSQGAKPVSVSVKGGGPITWEKLIEAVHRKLSDDLKAPVSRLFTFDGVQVTSLDQVEPDEIYVAAAALGPFHFGSYRARSLPTNFFASPRPRDRFLLPPISNKSSSQSSPEHSISSNNGYRRERKKREEDGVFFARPVQHKRSSEKVRQADYDQDNGGVFKAKSQNRATKGAKQVEDSRQTKTDLPVDQRPAEEVKEDVKKKDKKDKKGKKQQEENGSPDRYQDHPQRTYRANARRSDSPTNEQARREAERKRDAENRERVEKTRQQQEAARRKKEEKENRKRAEEEEDRKRAEEAQRRREEVEEERRKREEEERRWREEEERRLTEEEERRRLADEEEKQWQERQRREEEERNAAQASRHDDSQDRRSEHGRNPRENSYRSGTDLLRDEQRRNGRDSQARRTPTPEQETARGRDSRNRDSRDRAEEEVDWGSGPDDFLRSEEEELRNKAATTIQSGYRGWRARREAEERRIAKGLDQRL